MSGTRSQVHMRTMLRPMGRIYHRVESLIIKTGEAVVA